LELASLSQKSATWDEPLHLTAGYLAASEGDYRVDPSHPPLLRMWAALPLLAVERARPDTSQIDRSSDEAWLRQNNRFARGFLYGGPDADGRLFVARLMVVLWGVGLGIILFFWAREWLGFTPALFALTAYVIEPNLAAHARLVTTDLGASLFIFSTVYWLWRTSRQPNGWNIAGLAISFALAFVTKFSAVLLVPIVALLMGLAVAWRMPLRAKTSAGIAVLIACSTFAAIWAAYGFRYAPSASEGWLLQLQNTPLVAERAPLLAQIVTVIDTLHVLPNAYVQGVLMSQATSGLPAYLAGEYSTHGWWFYFPVAFLVKTPSVLILLFLGGAAMLVAHRRGFGIVNVAFVLLPIVVYMGFAIASGVNIGLRHILPVYPFAILIAAAAATRLAAWRQPLGKLALAGLMAFWCATFVRVYPHMLTFFNVFAGGPENGLAYLADSNLDWGQDLKLLKAWMTRRSVEHINLAYFGTADPGYYGIGGTHLPGTDFEPMFEKPVLPGYVAISATILSGVHLEPKWRLFYGGFSGLSPIATVGNSIFVYFVEQWPEASARTENLRHLIADTKVQAALASELFLGLHWTDHAIQLYRAALERDPDNVAVLEHLGLALLEGDRSGAAAEVLGRAVSLDPAAARTRYRLAMALMKAGRHEEAAAQAGAAVRLNPGDAGYLDLLGVAQAMSGELDAAALSFERALMLAPGNLDVREHLQRLRGP
jgi:tetratricopeptide (TPR) repeat protein